MAYLLELEGIMAGYGESVVLEDISLHMNEGDSLALLGRNGVGKTTLLLTIMGIARLHGGRMAWRGSDLTSIPTYERARAGLGWVPQERYVYPSLSVEEHLAVVARPGPWDAARVYALFPRLRERRRNFGNQLSGGEQQMLAIGRALMTNSKLLLLEEPMEGLAPMIIQELTGVISNMIAATGVGIVIVEQHARLALRLTRQALVLDRGRIVHAGSSEVLLNKDGSWIALSPCPSERAYSTSISARTRPELPAECFPHRRWLQQRRLEWAVTSARILRPSTPHIAEKRLENLRLPPALS